MYTYTYKRILKDGVYNINNPKDVDENGMSIPLAKRISNHPVFSTKIISVDLSYDKATVKMNVKLTDEELDFLDTIVSLHENENGTINKATTLQLTSKNGNVYIVCVTDSGQLITEQLI